MITTNHQLSNPFNGRWKVISLWRGVRGWRWPTAATCRRNRLVLEFAETGKAVFPSGNTLFCGNLRVISGSRPIEKSKYVLYTADPLLRIERHETAADGPHVSDFGGSYTIERSGENLIRLRGIEGTGQQPNYRRLKIKKLF